MTFQIGHGENEGLETQQDQDSLQGGEWSVEALIGGEAVRKPSLRPSFSVISAARPTSLPVPEVVGTATTA